MNTITELENKLNHIWYEEQGCIDDKFMKIKKVFIEHIFADRKALEDKTFCKNCGMRKAEFCHSCNSNNLKEIADQKSRIAELKAENKRLKGLTGSQGEYINKQDERTDELIIKIEKLKKAKEGKQG